MQPIKMVDLARQYLGSKKEIDAAIQSVLTTSDFIQGKAVGEFERQLSEKMGGAHIVTCANGTDALQIALMALDLKPGDEVIIPAFTYVATAEVIALLNLVPVFVDVDPAHFALDVNHVESLLTKKTAAVVPVHLFGQCAPMGPMLSLAKKKSFHVVEDAAQALGAEALLPGGDRQMAGTMGIVGTSSFFPSKNLGAYGDGGVMITRDAALSEKVRMIANHGQKVKYHHDIVGVNSRLDTLQAAILSVKLRKLEEYTRKRQAVADYYDDRLSKLPWLKVPARDPRSTHVFHQYTILVGDGRRDALRQHLEKKGIPSMIYYPMPLHFQKAYRQTGIRLPVSESLCQRVLSLPIHTEMDEDQLSYICGAIEVFH